MKNTFWSEPYRGHQIRGHFDCGIEVIEWLNCDTHVAKKVLSLRSAKLEIAKYVKSRETEVTGACHP